MRQVGHQVVKKKRTTGRPCSVNPANWTGWSVETSVRVKLGAKSPIWFPVSGIGGSAGTGVVTFGVGAGSLVGVAVVGVVPTSLVQAMLNSKRGAARQQIAF